MIHQLCNYVNTAADLLKIEIEKVEPGTDAMRVALRMPGITHVVILMKQKEIQDKLLTATPEQQRELIKKKIELYSDIWDTILNPIGSPFKRSRRHENR